VGVLENKTAVRCAEALLLHVSVRFARLFRCELDGESYGKKRPGLLANWSVDVCTVSRLGRFVLFCEEHSLFTFIIPSGYGRSLAPVLERFHRRREDLAREPGLSGLAPFSFTTFRFGKRMNRHNIGSQNVLIYLLRASLEDASPPLEGDQLRKVEDSLNQAPMSYLGMKSPRVALLHCHDTSRLLLQPAEGGTVISALLQADTYVKKRLRQGKEQSLCTKPVCVPVQSFA
jgi:hypothetical protein